VDAVVTNVWSKVKRDELLQTETSRVVIDSTERPRVMLRGDRFGVTVRLEGVELNMPESNIDVYDGMITSVAVRGPAPVVEVGLAHPTTPRVLQVSGLPSRTVLEFDRSPIQETFVGRRVVVDPGHGGQDDGRRGPIDLLEKNLALDIAARLTGLLENAGAQVLLTRGGDETLSGEARRIKAVAYNPHVVVSIHMNWSDDRNVRGTATAYATAGMRNLATAVQSGMVSKLKLPDLGIRAWDGEDAFAGLPAVYVECVTISNPVEEGWLRGCTFLHRAAQGIFNGVQAHLLTR
jgi:N-acetylmuramoyl-L-alanine amidase